MGINNPFLCANPATPNCAQTCGNSILSTTPFLYFTPHTSGEGTAAREGGFCSPSRALSLA
jgi:hypothetical protein